MAVALIFVVVIVAVLAFWPERWSHILNRLHKPPPSNYGWWGNSGDEADLLRCRVLTESEHK
jgi:hypothetical protein